MGLREAKRYIDQLHRKQGNPFLWPDYLTGLPDRQAVLKKLDDLYPKLGRHAIAFVRIANIHPYLLKYGYENHSELIQWAAAILKTTSKDVKGSFVGIVGTHDFLLTAPSKSIDHIINTAKTLFRKKALSFYNETDRKRGYVFSFKDDSGNSVKVGLMKLISYVIKEPPEVERVNLIPYMEKLCRQLEISEQKDSNQ